MMAFALAIYMILIVHLIRLATVWLKIGCLTRVDRLSTSPSRVFLLTLFFSVDVIVSLVKVVIEYRPSYVTPVEPFLLYSDIPLTALKIVGAIGCILHASRQSALIIVAAGLLFDAARMLTNLWLGLSFGQDPIYEALAAAITFYGLGRLNRETRLASLQSFSRVPLWKQVQGATAPVTEEVR